MTAFNQQRFQKRLATMGDPAEEACDLVHEGRTHKLGLDRVWQNGVGLRLNDMTTPMRYTPDRLTRWAFVECMGIGRDQTLKIKVEKIEALYAWQHLGPTELFVYDSVNDRWWQDSIEEWGTCFDAHGEIRAFPEGKEFVALHSDHFPTDPSPVPNAGAVDVAA